MKKFLLISTIFSIAFSSLAWGEGNAAGQGTGPVPDENAAPFQWEYGTDPLSVAGIKSPYPPDSPADKLWHVQAMSIFLKNKKKQIEEESQNNNESPIYTEGQTEEIQQQKKTEGKDEELKPVLLLSRFIGILAHMSSAMKVCHPEEVPLIESCGNIILNHWNEYSGTSLMPSSGTKRDDLKSVIKSSYENSYKRGIDEASKANKTQCDNMFKEEQESIIWKSCGRNLNKDDNSKDNQPVISSQ